MSFFIPPEQVPLVPGFFSQGNPAPPPPRTLNGLQHERNDLGGSSHFAMNESLTDAPVFTLDQESFALEGIQEASPMSRTFFSRRNMNAIQSALKNAVFAKGGYVIGPQSDTDLLIIMRGIYLQYARYQIDPQQAQAQIAKLNKIVVDHCTPKIISAILQYKGYMNDITKPRYIMPHPINANSAGEKTNRPVTDVLVGDPFN